VSVLWGSDQGQWMKKANLNNIEVLKVGSLVACGKSDITI